MTPAELFTRYAEATRGYARGLGWYLPGAEAADLEQEALTGLWLACRDWHPGLGPFWPFARMCARRRMVTAIRAAGRVKHGPLTYATRVAELEDGPADVLEALPAPGGDVCAQAAQREALISILRACGGLTHIERRAFFGVVQGRSYDEIDPAAPSRKRVDNALQRAKRKLARAVA